MPGAIRAFRRFFMADYLALQRRLVELETRVAFQEHALQQLSDVAARQQAEIERLKSLLKETQDRLRGVAPPVADVSEETPPPHY
jgi:SlyX protein